MIIKPIDGRETMKISKETMQNLKVLSQINTEAVFDDDGHIKIKNNSVIAYKSIKEDFPEFSIVDLHTFISLLGLFKESDVEFHGPYCLISNLESGAEIKYKFSEKSSIKNQLSKSVEYYENIKDFSGSFSLPKTVLKELESVSRMMNIRDLHIEIVNGSGSLKLFSDMQTNSDNYTINIEDASGNINACVSIDNMSIHQCDYDVFNINNNYLKFVPKNTDSPTYFIGAKR
jgi:hypothetical protein